MDPHESPRASARVRARLKPRQTLSQNWAGTAAGVTGAGSTHPPKGPDYSESSAAKKEVRAAPDPPPVPPSRNSSGMEGTAFFLAIQRSELQSEHVKSQTTNPLHIICVSAISVLRVWMCFSSSHSEQLNWLSAFAQSTHATHS